MEASETAGTTQEQPEPGVPIAHPKWPVPPRIRRTTLEQELAPYEVTRIPRPKPNVLHPSRIDLTVVEGDEAVEDAGLIDLTDES